ncbi:Cation channel sperm-associated protein subunit delta [Orchesella cincta]|uniref:Cation channel sperm-associated protein subunit delta n=1 Tax=Orchesella cincta TaxID=48709 RepID=A0A1D2M221_ORCCI|nr:Cation channel sperm-associated protein subunit delta [Orchesella cincta]
MNENLTNILTNELNFHVAVLRSEDGVGKQFPDPVNKISASTCCLKSEDCDQDDSIVAAYSFLQQRSDKENKFLYVSFDLGDTFEKRIIATQYSPVNLIKGFYKMYMRWHHYYEILTDPDEQDLKEDDELLSGLRRKPIWESSTVEEKEKLKFLEDRVPKRQARLQSGPEIKDLTPEWANEIIDKRRRAHGWKDGWNDENCDTIPECIEKFENDKAIEWLFNMSDIPIHVKTPRRNEDEPYCKDITSILVLPEKKHVMALCEIKYHRSSLDDKNFTSPSPPEVNYFALYSFPIKSNIPLVYGERVSKRIFSCRYIRKDDSNPQRLIQPELIRMPGSATIFIINCDGVKVIELLPDLGKTLFNSVFYFEYGKMNEYCKQNPTYTEPTALETTCKEKKSGTPAPPPSPSTPPSPTFLRTFRLCSLDTPPLLITDVSGTIILLTFGRFYARGVISYNREARLFVGEALSSEVSGGATLPEFGWTDKFRNLIFPTLNTNGEAILTIALLQAYSIDPAEENQFKKLYEHKHAMRLIPMPIQIHRDVKNYYEENLSLCHQAYRKNYGFERCQTNSFFIQPRKVTMDIGESKTVKVRVKDDNPLLPLWVFSSDENSVGVKAFLNRNPDQNLNQHAWVLNITAKPNAKNEEEAEALVDAFFGSDYNNLHDYSTQITLINLPTVRCHVQPSSTIQAEIGCKGKKLIAHEDSYRPQCKSFRKNFNYTLKKGNFDPDLANFWIEMDSKQNRPFLKLTDKGDLRITYDYARWGCPIEPFRNDPFIPDLKIVNETTANDTAKGKRFEGKFILVEIFGATGYSYSQKAGDTYANCKRIPQDLNELIKRWKYRHRLFEIATKRLKFPLRGSGGNENNVSGNRCFHNRAVKHHFNIWNRANYVSCETPTTVPSQMLNADALKREYQVMTTRTLADDSDTSDSFINLDDEKFLDEHDRDDNDLDYTLNRVEWKRSHQRVYVFLAIAVDGYGSLCNYATMFGVSLNTTPQIDNLLSFLIFLLFWFCWILLVVGGYYVRRRHLRISYMNQARADKLEEAAWKIVYRYEKLIHGKEMGHLMHMNTDEDDKETNRAGATYAARTAHDKRKAELRMKKTHIMAQEQARHERLQKLFQKQ